MNDSAIVFYNRAGEPIHEEPMEFKRVRFDGLDTIWGNARECRFTLNEYPYFIAARINGVACITPEFKISDPFKPGGTVRIRKGALFYRDET